MAENAFKTIETQDELDRIIAERLSRERTKYADYDALKADSDALKALQGQDLEGQIRTLQNQLKQEQEKTSGLTARAAAAEKASTRAKVAAKAKLPAELWDRITGEDEAAMTADAETLAKLFSGTGAQPPAPLAQPEGGKDAGAWGGLVQALTPGA